MTPGQADAFGIAISICMVGATFIGICIADRALDRRDDRRAVLRQAEDITRTAAKETQP